MPNKSKTSIQGITIAALNKVLSQKSAKWRLDDKLIGDMSLDDLQKSHTLGNLPEKKGTLKAYMPKIRSKVKTFKTIAKKDLKILPKSWDWRNVNENNYVSSVKDQGGCGSCVAFAVAAAMESHYRIQQVKNSIQEPIDLSEASLFFTAQRQCNTGDPRVGWWINVALQAAVDEGVCLEANYPYKPVNQEATILDGGTRILKIHGYDSTSNIKTMKQWLVCEGPLVTCFDVYQDFYGFFHGAKEQVYSHVTGTKAGSHAVCVIGYDDGRQAWLCKNSWGGNSAHPDGCFWIGYGQCGIDNRMYVPQDVYDKYTIDILEYNPKDLKIQPEDDGKYLLTDGKSRMKMFANHEDAVNGLRVAMRHTQHCFVGRDNSRTNRKDYIFEYWSGNSGLPYYSLTKNDVISYDPVKVVAQHIREDGWRIQEGNHGMFLADDMDDALAILNVVERFRRVGFIGRNNKEKNRKDYIMTYFE